MRSSLTRLVFCLGLVSATMSGCARSSTPPADTAPPDTLATRACPDTTVVEPEDAAAAAGQRDAEPSAPSIRETAGAWMTFKGAWFDVSYPSTFKAVPGQKSSTSGGGVDAASFVSPDGRVEFYVFSPQWGGEPEWIALRPGERIAARSEETGGRSPQAAGDKRTVRVTIAGPGSSYTRSYVDTYEGDAVRHVIGIRYADQAAYNAHRDLYLKFKASLKQYAD